jgi:hypothetical protein
MYQGRIRKQKIVSRAIESERLPQQQQQQQQQQKRLGRIGQEQVWRNPRKGQLV